jgi:hypothetical protein
MESGIPACYFSGMGQRVHLVSRRFVDLRRVASQMCRDTEMRQRDCL